MSSILAFDTATSACSAALLINGGVCERFEIAPQRHAEIILSMIEGLLAEAGVTLKSLDAVAFGGGPGSFMGLRIAAGIAQGLAFGADLPVIPVSTLQTLAQTAYFDTGEKNILSAWDARMNAVYWGAYRLSAENIMEAIQADALAEPQAVFMPAGKAWCAAGNAWQVYQEPLQRVLQACQKIFPEIYPRASALVKIAEVFYDQGKLQDPLNVEPVYLRDQIAHVKKI